MVIWSNRANFTLLILYILFTHRQEQVSSQCVYKLMKKHFLNLSYQTYPTLQQSMPLTQDGSPNSTAKPQWKSRFPWVSYLWYSMEKVKLKSENHQLNTGRFLSHSSSPVASKNITVNPKVSHSAMALYHLQSGLKNKLKLSHHLGSDRRLLRSHLSHSCIWASHS